MGLFSKIKKAFKKVVKGVKKVVKKVVKGVKGTVDTNNLAHLGPPPYISKKYFFSMFFKILLFF